jgi:hypothetical protein
MRRWQQTASSLLAILFAVTAYAHGAAGVAGTWHVAIPGWGIEDHLLVVEERDGGLTGKFEFADVKGTVTGAQVEFDVTNASGAVVLHFEGTVAGETMNGTTRSPADGPLAHLAEDRLTTEWTAKREPQGH